MERPLSTVKATATAENGRKDEDCLGEKNYPHHNAEKEEGEQVEEERGVVRSEPVEDYEGYLYQENRKNGEGRGEDEVLFRQVEFLDVPVGELKDNGNERKKYEKEEEHLARHRRPPPVEAAEPGKFLQVLLAYLLPLPDDHFPFLDGETGTGQFIAGGGPDGLLGNVSHLILPGRKGELYVDERGEDEGKKDEDEIFSQGETRGRFILFVLHFFRLRRHLFSRTPL